MNVSHHRNPSREECESTIRRILEKTEDETGRNHQFRKPSDFYPYFSSLYPSSDGLKKQIQRAVTHMNLLKDRDGFYTLERSEENLRNQEEIRRLFRSHVKLIPSSDLQEMSFLFLAVKSPEREYLLRLLSREKSLSGKYLTMIDSSDGILFLTEQPDALLSALSSFNE